VVIVRNDDFHGPDNVFNKMNYRNLTKGEIDILISQNCLADNWAGVSVMENFTPENLINTRFEGKIKLGRYSETIEVEKGISKKCGIYNSVISNCEIGSGVLISDVKYLSDYIIKDDTVISNVGSMTVSGDSLFGNGTEIEVLNEAGGRELPLFDRLSAQIAYLTVLYRHDKDFTEKMLAIIKSYCESKRTDMGVVSEGSRILNTLIISNVNIGSYSVVSGASLLEEGTIESCREAPVLIGAGVIAKKFLILSGSTVDEGAILDKSFVGQGVKIGRQLSAENSAFFANCEAFHSETCSLFAGPYSVTHHKSTLLIASLVSFFNAGSGTNQSNHMYKLGPLHQGIFERGSKTGSFSYLLLPCHIGAYTVVIGKHYSNFDSSDFPFSYISEEKGKSELTPAMNLFTVGTRRDIDKWPARDRRKDPVKLDLIHFDLLNPYIAGKIYSAIGILNDLESKTDKSHDYVTYKGLSIRRLLFKTTRKYYEMALKIYIGSEVVKRLSVLDYSSSLSDLRKMLRSGKDAGTGNWADILGMFSPSAKINELVDLVSRGEINSLEKLSGFLESVYNSYNNYSWEWCAGLINQMTGSIPEMLSVDSLIELITDWKTNTVKLNNMTLKDAEKEFDTASKIGFGIDGNEDTRNSDFQAVRGVYEKNRFVISLQKESEEIEDKAFRLISILGKFK
jgi:NDP-sugar pyrophosphorylase family protein